MNLASLVLFVVLYATSNLALAADPLKTPAGPETVMASRSLELSGVSGWHVRDIVLKAAAEHAELAGVPADRVGDYVSVTPSGGHSQSTKRAALLAPEILEITANLSGADAAAAGAKPRAAEYLDAIVASLERELQDFHGGRTEAAKRNLSEVERRLQDAESIASSIEAKIRSVTDRVDASIDPIRAAVPKLEEERQSLKLQVIGKQARQQALAEAIERHAKGAEERLKDDEVTAQLQKIVATREQRLKIVRSLHQAGDAPQAAVDEAETALAEANTRVLERREVVKLSAGGGEVLGTLNRELAMLSIDVAEAEAKLSAVEKMLNRYGDAQPLLAEAERVRRDRERLEKSRDLAEAALRDAQATVPDPVFRVLDAKSARADMEKPAGSPPK